MLSRTFNVLDILWYPVSIIGVNMIGPRTAFKIEVLRRLENAILHLVYAHNRAILPIL